MKPNINDLLPSELLTLIFQFTSSRHFNLSISLVCKHWNFLYNHPTVRGQVPVVIHKKKREWVLKVLSLDKFSKLQKLYIRGVPMFGNNDLLAISKCKFSKHLHTLELAFLKISSEVFDIIGKNFKNLKSLFLSFSNAEMEIRVDHVRSFVEGCSGLKRLTLFGAAFSDSELSLISNLQNLEHISFILNARITDSGIKLITKNCKKLKSITLAVMMALTDESLKAISQLDHLERLTVDKVNRCSIEGIEATLKSCKCLKEVNVSMNSQELRDKLQQWKKLCPYVKKWYGDHPTGSSNTSTNIVDWLKFILSSESII